ncbi:MAG TPA: hypothetical protein VKT74_09210 [Gammaproteobacteria bacterium]|nr:hypothetical protein [Gammaproteobacteria bacterium]
MKNLLYIFAAYLTLVLAACSSNDQDQAAATKAPPPGTGPVQISKSNVFSPLVQDLNKAKAVNGQVQQQFQKTNGQVEAPTASSAPSAASANGP